MFDYVLQGGLVADGTGQSSFQGMCVSKMGKLPLSCPTSRENAAACWT